MPEELRLSVRGHTCTAGFRGTLTAEIQRWAALAVKDRGVVGVSVGEKARSAALSELAAYVSALNLGDQRLVALQKCWLALGKGIDTPFKATGETAAVLAHYGALGGLSDSSRCLDEFVAASVDNVQKYVNEIRSSVAIEKREVRARIEQYRGVEDRATAAELRIIELEQALDERTAELAELRDDSEYLSALAGETVKRHSAKPEPKGFDWRRDPDTPRLYVRGLEDGGRRWKVDRGEAHPNGRWQAFEADEQAARTAAAEFNGSLAGAKA